MENPRSKTYSFEKLTQFSQENNVLDAAASNIDLLLGEIHVFPKRSRIVLV